MSNTINASSCAYTFTDGKIIKSLFNKNNVATVKNKSMFYFSDVSDVFWTSFYYFVIHKCMSTTVCVNGTVEFTFFLVMRLNVITIVTNCILAAFIIKTWKLAEETRFKRRWNKDCWIQWKIFFLLDFKLVDFPPLCLIASLCFKYSSMI